MLVWTGPNCMEDLEELYSLWRLRDESSPSSARDYFFVIRHRESGRPAGNCGVRFVEATAAGRERVGNIGYWLGEEFWGAGLMSEAVRLLVWLSFEHLAAASVEAKCLSVNMGSQRVLEKCGFLRDANYQQIAADHGPHSGVCELRFELTREEYLHGEKNGERFTPASAHVETYD
jgi:[ribosomal protein S5]-alanine N-acetyltransferase